MFRSVRNPRWALLAVGAALLSLLTVASAGGVAGQTPSPTTPAPATQPDSPVAYAEATFNAWLNYDAPTLINVTEPTAAQVLLARDPGADSWSSTPLCEGAAGSTYCTWASESSQLLLRVANEAASQGQPHAVTEAAFITTVDGIAIWPFTTQEAADNTQAMVDQGHSPWMVDPATVIQFFVESTLGWYAPIVEPTLDTTRWLVTDSATGVVVDVTMTQPSRQGFGGIWAVTRLGSLATAAPTPGAE